MEFWDVLSRDTLEKNFPNLLAKLLLSGQLLVPCVFPHDSSYMRSLKNSFCNFSSTILVNGFCKDLPDFFVIFLEESATHETFSHIFGNLEATAGFP